MQKHIPIEQVNGAMVVVLCNLKPRQMPGILSAGMVLCANNEDASVIEFLNPPAGSEPGDVVTFEGFERKPLDVLPAKKSPWETVAPKFITDGNMVGVYKGENGNIPFKTSKGVCTATKIANGLIK